MNNLLNYFTFTKHLHFDFVNFLLGEKMVQNILILGNGKTRISHFQENMVYLVCMTMLAICFMQETLKKFFFKEFG
jgi:hypothetical protein